VSRTGSLLRSAAIAFALTAFAGEPATAAADDDAPVVPLPVDARDALAALGEGVVGGALPARPIREPAKLRHLEPGTWTYEIVDGANRGQVQTVVVERVSPDDTGAAWRVVTDGDEIQQLRVTTEHEVLKLSQTDRQSDRSVVYRPGLVLEPGMRAGESKTVETRLVTYKASRPDEIEYEGTLAYTTRYVGAYRVTTPAGRFDARLLEHHYVMRIGPATAENHSYDLYADGVGAIAEVARESVSALWIYRRSSESARVLLRAPTD